jgi:hypothetical protein
MAKAVDPPNLGGPDLLPSHAQTIQRQQSTLVAILKNLPVNTDRLHGS